MSTTLPTPSQIEAIIEIARLAPSVHNSQPWQAKLSGNSLVISLDTKHALKDGDPTGRQSMISLGIFTEALDIGAQAHGLQISETKQKNQDIIVSFAPFPALKINHENTHLLKLRSSDRSIYSPASITPHLVDTLKQTSSAGISVQVVSAPDFIQTTADLTSKGIQLALSSPSFRKELSQCLVLPWSTKNRGISVKSLYIADLLAVLQPIMLRLGLGIQAEARLEKKRWESASAVIVICGEGDLQRYWFEAGRTYLRVSLALQKEGLSQATSAAVVEASNYHEDIEAMLGTNQRVLAMLRVGTGSPKKYYSPRLRAADILKAK